MISEKLEVRIKGYVTFSILDASGNISSEFGRHNDIQVAAKDIVARNLIADPATVLETISLYYLGNLVKAAPINLKQVVSTAEVSFQALFLPTDFNGSFDTARLTDSAAVDFSVFAGLIGTKDAAHSLLVTWNISIL